MITHTPLPVLVFDGDCGFCTTSARFAARWVIGHGSTGSAGSTSVMPWQQLSLPELGLTADQCRAAVQWVGVDGQTASGHEAVSAVLRAGHPVWRPVGSLLVAPGFSWLSERVYSWVADHRYALPGGTPACRVDRPSPPS